MGFRKIDLIDIIGLESNAVELFAGWVEQVEPIAIVIPSGQVRIKFNHLNSVLTQRKGIHDEVKILRQTVLRFELPKLLPLVIPFFCHSSKAVGLHDSGLVVPFVGLKVERLFE